MNSNRTWNLRYLGAESFINTINSPGKIPDFILGTIVRKLVMDTFPKAKKIYTQYLSCFLQSHIPFRPSEPT